MSLQVKIKAPSSEKVIRKIKAELHSPQFIQQIQAEVVEGQIKRLIRSGQSPVEGFGRFVQYKDKDNYPAGKKPASPVNLTLSGSLLKFYSVARKAAMSIVIGISPSASEEVKTRAKANNEGTLGLEGKKLDRAARERIKEKNLPLAKAGRGGKKRRTLQEVARETSGVPARRIVPIKKEAFTISVISKLKNLYARRLKALMSKR